MAQGNNPLFAGMSGTFGPIVVYQRGGRTVLRERVYHPRNDSTETQTRRRSAFASLARDWSHADATRQAAWSRLGARVPDWDGTRGGRPLSGYHCFLAVNSGRLALGLTPTRDAPDTPDLPPFLPPPALAASAAGGVLSLTLTCGAAPFDAPVQVYAARPSSPVGATPRVKDMALLATLDGLPAGGADIGPVYAARFGLPAPGQGMTVRAVPLSPSGFRGQAVTASGVVGA